MTSRPMIAFGICILLTICCFACRGETDQPKAKGIDFSAIESPILVRGNERQAYRDPAAIYHDGVFYLYFTFVQIEPDGRIYSYTAMSKSRDLVEWTEKKIITPKGQKLNYCSPGNVIRFGQLEPSFDKVVGHENAMQNRIYARNKIAGLFRRGEVSYAQAVKMTSLIPHAGDRQGALLLLRAAVQDRQQGGFRVDRFRYAFHWLDRMAAKIFGIMAHRNLEKGPYALLPCRM